jgi:hypothetical protein
MTFHDSSWQTQQRVLKRQRQRFAQFDVVIAGKDFHLF